MLFPPPLPQMEQEPRVPEHHRVQKQLQALKKPSVYLMLTTSFLQGQQIQVPEAQEQGRVAAACHQCTR